MEKGMEVNVVRLVGRVVGEPEFSHKIYGEAYYMIMLGILRKSGYEDRIRLVVSERLLCGRSPNIGEALEIKGQIRTYNREISGRNKLEITVFVRTMGYIRENKFNCEDIDCENIVHLEGFICKTPIRRTSPMGREICDLMIAINRQYNKSDYVPTIAWGKNAVFCEMLNVGDKVIVDGRIQSREYRKCEKNEEVVTRTAYEVSVVGIDMA